MIKCGDQCDERCRSCVYMYKKHDPDLHENSQGLCTIHREPRGYGQTCSSFHCFELTTNDPNDERIISQKPALNGEGFSIKAFLKTGLWPVKRS